MLYIFLNTKMSVSQRHKHLFPRNKMILAKNFRINSFILLFLYRESTMKSYWLYFPVISQIWPPSTPPVLTTPLEPLSSLSSCSACLCSLLLSLCFLRGHTSTFKAFAKTVPQWSAWLTVPCTGFAQVLLSQWGLHWARFDSPFPSHVHIF